MAGIPAEFNARPLPRAGVSARGLSRQTREVRLSTMQSVVSRDGTPIAFDISGSGPGLVLVHGTAATHRGWKAVVPLLAQRFTVLAMERRGRGESGDSADYAAE